MKETSDTQKIETAHYATQSRSYLDIYRISVGYPQEKELAL
jgi:hypothetical protein